MKTSHCPWALVVVSALWFSFGCEGAASSRCSIDEDCGPGQSCSVGLCRARPDVAAKEPEKTTTNPPVPPSAACASCPVPLNAASLCKNDQCGRGPCEAEFYDFDSAVFGCETRCTGLDCVDTAGKSSKLTAPPVHERASSSTFAAGGSLGASVLTSASHSLFGVAGESTPGGGNPSGTSADGMQLRPGITSQVHR